MTYIQFRKHPRSGETYIVESTRDDLYPFSNDNIIRAVGPCRVTENGTYTPDGVLLTGREDLMRDWLDNAGTDAYDDAAWLREELGNG